MTNKEKSYEHFKFVLKETILNEQKCLKTLFEIDKLINDAALTNYLTLRKNFLNNNKSKIEELQPLKNYRDNPQMIDKLQKEYYLTLYNFRHQALSLMAKNQRLWLGALFNNYFENLKFLFRNLLISPTNEEKVVIEKVVQEIELLRSQS